VFGCCEGPFGAHAEYMTIPEDGSIATMPESSTFAEVALGTEDSHYALAVIRAAKIGSGKDVLVYGATGVIGSAAGQLAKSAGAFVTAVCIPSTSHWSKAWVPTESSTTPSMTSQTMSRRTISSSMLSARAHSASANAC